MKKLLAVFVALSAIISSAASINRMVVRQQWPWSGKVRVEYLLSGVTAPQDVSVALSQGGETIDVSGTDKFTFLVGDLHGVGNGFHSFTIDAGQLPASVVRDADVTVSLSLSDSPSGMTDAIYMIVDLVNASNITYVTRADLLDGKYGTYETDYSVFGDGFSTPLPNPIVWTGVTNDVKYMTTHMVLRKIPVANQVFALGAPETWLTRAGPRDVLHKAKLTSDFWIGVFEVTQSQYAKMGGALVTHYFTNPDCADTRPAERVTYERVRGANLGAQWGNDGVSVANGRKVDNNTWFDLFRKRSGLERLDLPSGAQWEIACMASQTEVPLYSGESYVQTSFNTNTKDANLDKLARYKWNDGYTNVSGNASYPAPAADCDTSFGTAKVGSYAPNAYGLYDMLGNVSEWTLDYAQTNATSTCILINPVGGTRLENGRRTRRGGSWFDAIGASVTRFTPAFNYASQQEGYIGLRVCYTEQDGEPSTEEE